MNHQNCVGNMSERIMMIPETIAITAKNAHGPLRKKPPPAHAFYKAYAGGGIYILFILPEPILRSKLIEPCI